MIPGNVPQQEHYTPKIGRHGKLWPTPNFPAASRSQIQNAGFSLLGGLSGTFQVTTASCTFQIQYWLIQGQRWISANEIVFSGHFCTAACILATGDPIWCATWGMRNQWMETRTLPAQRVVARIVNRLTKRNINNWWIPINITVQSGRLDSVIVPGI